MFSNKANPGVKSQVSNLYCISTVSENIPRKKKEYKDNGKVGWLTWAQRVNGKMS